jgi:hypothetical protein
MGKLWRVQPYNNWNKRAAQYIRLNWSISDYTQKVTTFQYRIVSTHCDRQHNTVTQHHVEGFTLRFSRYIALNRNTLQTRNCAVFLHVICLGCTNTDIYNIVSAAEYLISDVISIWLANSSKIFIFSGDHISIFTSELMTRCHICVALMWGVT